MSGICGFACGDGRRDVSQPALQPMIDALNFGQDSGSDLVSFGPIGIGGASSTGRRLYVTKRTMHERPVTLWIHGTLLGEDRRVSADPSLRNLIGGLLDAYCKEGVAFLEKLRGDFSLALWDGIEEKLVLATDRFRVHPLFYFHDSEKIVFGSRIQSILASPFVMPERINPFALVDLMAFSAVTSPRTVFCDIQKIPPGHFLTWSRGTLKLSQYWDIDFTSPYRDSEEHLIHQLKSHLGEAVSLRVASDAENRIGAFLSGGVDSSTVTGILTQASKSPVKCFSIGFSEQRFNEMSYARIAAQHFGAQHFEYIVTPQDTREALPVLMSSFDEPFANASAIPTYCCAKLAAKNGVNTLYAGDGGDEIFAGNERYSGQRVFDYYSDLPQPLREWFVNPCVFGLAKAFPFGIFLKGAKYIRRASIPYPQRITSYGLFNVIPLIEMFEAGFLDSLRPPYDPYSPIQDHYAHSKASCHLDRQLYIDLKLTISDNDLFKVTRMTEAAGVGVRFPFLDHKLIEFGARVPARVKMPGRELRVFFKKAYADLLPKEVLTKTKHGFGLPIPVWLRTDKALNEMMHDLVLAPRSVQRGYFKRQTLEKLIDLHRTEETSFYGDILWNVMVWELWLRRNVDERPRIREAERAVLPGTLASSDRVT